MRVALVVAYNGHNFLGSQVQKETQNTVFGHIEHIFKNIGVRGRCVASGRTDKGVHATGQVFHIDLPEFWTDLKKLKTVLNHMLPNYIHIKDIKSVGDDFHARYSAKKRVYRYIIKNSNANPFECDFVTFLQECDFENIKENISLFEGEHNFKEFMKMGSETKSSIRTIYKAFAYKHKDYIILHFEANGFLRSQIRLMVGALLTLSKDDIVYKLENKKKIPLKPAPANGLYLAKIKY
jgi:tRNA pseudouridine38-40 synthase